MIVQCSQCYQSFSTRSPFQKSHCCCCITGLCTSYRQGEIELDINWKLFRVLDMLKWFVVFLSCDFLRSLASLIYFTVHCSPNLAKPNDSMMDETQFQNNLSDFKPQYPCLQDVNFVEHLWDVIERLVQSMDQPTGNGMQLWSLKLHWIQYLQRASDISQAPYCDL